MPKPWIDITFPIRNGMVGWPGNIPVKLEMAQTIEGGAVCNVTNIITYGRPGTPMQAWGVAGGGPKNVQSIQDLVAYIRSIQLTPDQAKAQAAKDLASARTEPAANVKAASDKLVADNKALATSGAAA